MSFYSGTIQKGSQGSDVRAWQEFLNSQGYNLTVDGIFSDNTYAATTDYQTKNGLTADGIVGEDTWGKAGFSNINTPVSAPTIAPTPTAPTYDTTSWDDTEKGSAAAGAYEDAKDAVTGYGDFTFSEQAWLDKVKENIANYGEFSYNFNEDALYQQYKDKYIAQGKLAMADTMGQAAALTGGYGNSYAVTAGNQAYQAHLQNLNDIIPELYSMALDRYKMGKDDLYNQYGMLLSEYEREHGLYSDEYNKLLDALGIAKDDYYNGADMFYTEQNISNDVASKEFNDEMSIWEANTAELWNQAKWDEAARQYAIGNIQWQQEFEATNGSSGSSSGGSSGGSGSGTGGSGSGYDNGSVSESDIKEMQNALGITADGKWGSESQKAAGGLTADEAYKAWKNGELGKEYATKGFKDFDEETYNANVKEKGGSYYETALNDLNYMASAGKGAAEMTAYLQELIGNSYISKSEYQTLLQWIRENAGKNYSAHNQTRRYGVTR